MRNVRSLIIGSAIVASIIAPLSASAANVKIVDFDTKADGNSLYLRIIDGSVIAPLREYATVHDPITGKPLTFSQTNMDAQLNWANNYKNSAECALKISKSNCDGHKK